MTKEGDCFALMTLMFCSSEWFSTTGYDFAHHLSGTFLEGVLLASHGWRPGMLLNILGCTKKSPPTKNYLAQNIIMADVEKPWSREKR